MLKFYVTLETDADDVTSKMEPKSGKLYKFGHGIFGPKWTEKWVHLDGHLLKYFSMASEQQPLFTLSSARQSCTVDLALYTFSLHDDKRITRKHAFHLVPTIKTHKAVVFACSSEGELKEWQAAFQSRVSSPPGSKLSPLVAEKMRRTNEVFSLYDPRRTDRIDAAKLRTLLQSVGWEGDTVQFSMMQQELDPYLEGRISRDRFVSAMRTYFLLHEVHHGPQDGKDALPTSSYASRPTSMAERSSVVDGSVDTDYENNQCVNDSSKTSESECAERTSITCEEVTPHNQEKPTAQTQDDEFIDWNAEYLRLKARNGDETSIHALEVANLLKRFRVTAEELVQGIVCEGGLDDEFKTFEIHSVHDDHFLATAGHSVHPESREKFRKFQCNGLLVYMIDQADNIETVHKLLAQQLRVAAFFEASLTDTVLSNGTSRGEISSILIPLQCIIDYLGFRALVIAPPRHTEASLESIRDLAKRALSDKASAQLRELCDSLRLDSDTKKTDEQHSRRISQRLPSFVPAEVGGCIVEDRLYLHNVGAMLPLDTFDRPLDQTTVTARFRPELAAMYRESQSALPCDVGEGQPELLVSEYLRCAITPALVASLETNQLGAFDSKTLTRALHLHGINARYLGICYQLASLKHIRRLFLTELVARACKHELRVSLRATVTEVFTEINTAIREDDTEHLVPEDHQKPRVSLGSLDAEAVRLVAQETVIAKTKQVTIEFFNLVLGFQSPESATLWQERILPRAKSKFFKGIEEVGSFTFEDLVSGKLLHWPQLFHAMQYHCQVHIDDSGDIDFQATLPLPQDICVVLAPISDTIARTASTYERDLDAVDELNIDQALDLMKLQLAITEIAPADKRSLSYCHIFTSMAELCLCLERLDEASTYASLAVESEPKSHGENAKALVMLAKSKHVQGASQDEVYGLFKQAQDKALAYLGEIHPIHFDLLMTMMEIAMTYCDLDLAFRYYQDAANVVKECYGKTSLLYADIRRQQGETLLREDRNDEATGVLEECLALYERAMQQSENSSTSIELKKCAASCAYMLADAQAASADPNTLEIAFSSAFRAFNIRKSVYSVEDEDILSSMLQLGTIANQLGDVYRAMEYYRPVLQLRERYNHEDGDSQVRKLTQVVLHLHLTHLPVDKQAILEKTKKRYASLLGQLSTANESPNTPVEPSDESQLLVFTMKKLLESDPMEYVDSLLDRADQEFIELRRQSFMSSVRVDGTADASSPLRLQSPRNAGSSRFASFSFGQPTLDCSNSPRSSPAEVTSPLRTSRDGRLGEFACGAQLAAILHLDALCQ